MSDNVFKVEIDTAQAEAALFRLRFEIEATTRALTRLLEVARKPVTYGTGWAGGGAAGVNLGSGGGGSGRL